MNVSAFDQFWAAYPRKVGKLAAQRAFVGALKQAALADILAGVERYKKTKPAYADWCHPTTFLRQGRWMDEPDLVREDRRCGHDPLCKSTAQCYERREIEDAVREGRISQAQADRFLARRAAS